MISGNVGKKLCTITFSMLYVTTQGPTEPSEALRALTGNFATLNNLAGVKAPLEILF